MGVRPGAFVSRCVVAAVAGVLLHAPARGDGGTVRLMETSGPFVVTVFSAPQPLRVAPADLSVLLQDRGGGTILDADVSIDIRPPPGADAAPLRLVATRAQATNKLLYAAPFEPSAPGIWTAHVTVRRGAERAEVGCALPVTRAATPGLAGSWPFLVIPPAAVALYALHQWLSRRRWSPRRTLTVRR